jgi:hypothetical protein
MLKKIAQIIFCVSPKISTAFHPNCFQHFSQRMPPTFHPKCVPRFTPASITSAAIGVAHFSSDIVNLQATRTER